MKKKLLIPAVILVILLAAHPVYLRAIGRSVIVNDKLQKADAVLVLSGDNPKGDRLKAGVKLLKNKWADKLVLSGNYIAWETNLADIMQRQAIRLGVKKDRIIKIKHESDSTIDERETIIKVLERNKIKSIILVTSNFHTKRASRILKESFRDKIKFTVHAVRDKYYYPNPDNWWKSRIQAKTLFLELVKTGWSYFEL